MDLTPRDHMVYNNQPVLSSDIENDNMDDVEYHTDSEVEDPDYKTNPPNGELTTGLE
ncbi:hypothetical protein J6590_054723 [Homalodisca vitripennis]|nr:hypothetical protein J6590_054723 [Homalodisca vitripennis]